jgi:uncharacterized protein involved in exopolysaccharide biosynthesis
MESFWNNSNLLDIFLKWKKHIIIITFFGTLIIGASTFLIQRKYQSTAVVYPINLGSLSEESYSEQMIQMLKSRDIIDKVMKKFDLPTHYNMDSNYVHFQSTMYYLYKKNVEISKNEFDAVEISVIDVDAETAKNMVNAIINFYNDKVRDLLNYKLKELIEINKTTVNDFKKEQDSLQKRIQILNTKAGLIDVKTQVKAITKGLYSSNGNAKTITKAEAQLDSIRKYAVEYNALTCGLDSITGNILHLESKINTEETEYNSKITYAHIVSSPYAQDNKYSPKRIPITLFGGLAIFVLLMIIIAFLERKRQNI